MVQLLYFIQITGDELSFGEGHDRYQTKQGRFACKLCGRYFYHANALVTHYEKEHDEILGISFTVINV